MQGVLLLLILISTINMLVESHTACRFEVRSEPPAANAGLGTSHYQRTCDEVAWSSNPNLHPHPNPNPNPSSGPNPNPDPNQVTWSAEQTAQFEAIETACILAFSLEFVARLLAAPATVGQPASQSVFTLATVGLSKFWSELALTLPQTLTLPLPLTRHEQVLVESDELDRPPRHHALLPVTKSGLMTATSAWLGLGVATSA